jgi:hypothetical protein
LKDSVSGVPVFAPGGELDPAHPESGLYRYVPKPGKVPPGAACRAAKAYVDAVQAGRYADVAKLYADDAVILGPMGKVISGRQAIDHFYGDVIAKMKPKVVGVAYAGDETDCMLELAAISDGPGDGTHYRLSSIDHFTVNAEGKVTRMIVFVRP